MRYEDFVLQIGPDGDGGHSVRVVKSPAGEGRGRLELPPHLLRYRLAQDLPCRAVRGGARHLAPPPAAEAPRAEVPDSGEPLDGAPGDGAPGDEVPGDGDTTPALATSRQVGEELFRALFPGRVLSLYDQSLGLLGSGDGLGLRIKLKLDPAAGGSSQIDRLPWELLCRGDTEDYLGLSRRSPIVRYLDVPRPVRPIPLPKPLRILAVLSSPRGLEALDLDREVENLEEIRSPGIEMEILRHASAGAVRKALLERPFHVVHFMGHGGFDPPSGEGVVYFETPAGDPEAVRGADLATKLKDFPSLGLVVLNACDTAQASAIEGQSPFAGVATALVLGGLPAVVAMQQPISDAAAIELGSVFYARLAAGDLVDEALTEGRQAIHSADPASVEWATPVLFLRVPDGTVFEAAPNRRPGWGRMWRRSRAALLAAAMLVPSFAFLPGIGGPLWRLVSGTTYAHQVEIAQEFSSNIPGLSGRLDTIELLPDGRMRLNFAFVNETDRDLDLDFDPGKTYLADEHGNRYEVLESGLSHRPAESSGARGPKRTERWFDFPAPRDGARMLNVGLVSRQKGVEFPLFETRLPEIPERYTLQTVAPPPPEGSEVLELDGAEVRSSVEGLGGRWTGVELDPSGRMRWHLEIRNLSDADQKFSFHYEHIYLLDEHGNRYDVLGSSTGARAGGAANAYQGLLQRKVRGDFWFEFEGPIEGARQFRLVLGTDRGSPSFSDLEVEVPEYPARFSRKAKPAEAPVQEPEPRTASAEPAAPPETVEAEPESEPPPETPPPAPEPVTPVRTLLSGEGPSMDSSVETLSGRLVSVQTMSNGRLRLGIELVNRGPAAQPVGFDPEGTYLSDTRVRYKLVASDLPEGAPVTVAAGSTVRQWFEFPRPDEHAERLLLVLASDRPEEVRFRPLFVELPADS